MKIVPAATYIRNTADREAMLDTLIEWAERCDCDLGLAGVEDDIKAGAAYYRFCAGGPHDWMHLVLRTANVAAFEDAWHDMRDDLEKSALLAYRRWAGAQLP